MEQDIKRGYLRAEEWNNPENLNRFNEKVNRYMETDIFSLIHRPDETEEENGIRFQYEPDSYHDVEEFLLCISDELDQAGRGEGDTRAKLEALQDAIDEIHSFPQGDLENMRSFNIAYRRLYFLKAQLLKKMAGSTQEPHEIQSYSFQAAEAYMDADLLSTGKVSDYGRQVAILLGQAGDHLNHTRLAMKLAGFDPNLVEPPSNEESGLME